MTRHPCRPTQAAASMPSSPTSYAQLTQPAIPPRMNKAAAVRTAAAQRKLRAKQQPATAAHAASLGCAGSTECALPATAPSGPVHGLASPLHTARPGYAQRSGTPTATLPVFELGEAGVEPYSVQPAGRGAAAGSAVAGASASDSPLSLKKYQADRAQYLQVRWGVYILLGCYSVSWQLVAVARFGCTHSCG